MEFHKIQIYFMILKIICLKNVCVPFKQLRVFKEGADGFSNHEEWVFFL